MVLDAGSDQTLRSVFQHKLPIELVAVGGSSIERYRVRKSLHQWRHFAVGQRNVTWRHRRIVSARRAGRRHDRESNTPVWKTKKRLCRRCMPSRTKPPTRRRS